MADPTDSLLLGFTAPIYNGADNTVFIEDQTLTGLREWRRNFSHVIAFTIAHDGPAPPGWSAISLATLEAEGIEVIGLPDTYDRAVLLRQRSEVSDRLLELMRRTDYHAFGYGGWLGDPGEIAASTARRHGIPHAVWFDRVESQVVRNSAGEGVIDRLKATIKGKVITLHERRAVRQADLSLLHGATVFDHFENIARNPHQVEDIHFTDDDRLGPEAVAQKARAAHDGPLRIIYCGRASRMKGPMDWLKVLTGLKKRKVAFTARWVGDGELLDEMRSVADAIGLAKDELVLEGFVSDRNIVRQFYRDAHLQMFCHLTDESPRNLIESLHSATPLVGYSDPFSAGLVNEKGAGLLVQRGATEALTDAIAALSSDRPRLSDLIAKAGASAAHLTRAHVFRHRCEIIRSQMPPARRAA